MNSIRYIFILFVFMLSIANSASIPPKLTKAQNAPIIKEVKYEGIVYISDVIANDIANIELNKPLESRKINKAINEFYKQGYFRDIWATLDNGILTFHFKEKPRIGNIEIKGYGSESDRTALIEQLGLKRGDMFDSIKLENAKQTIKDILEHKGYYGSIVEATSKQIEGSSAYSIVLNVNQGNEIIIKQAKYEGQKELKIKDLEELSANKQSEFLGWLWGRNDGKLKINELEYDSMRIQDAYMRKGFLDAQVSPPLLEASFSDYSAKLFYKIQEGKRYKVKGIQIVLESPVIDEKEILDSLSVKEGEYFDVQKLRNDLETIKVKVSDKGYPLAVVNPDLDKSNDEVTVIYMISPGKKVYINDVIITGNTRSEDRIIRREILLAPGDLYNHTKVKRSENALRRLGYFENVTIDTKRISQDYMDLIVTVTEGRTGEITFGLGYGSYDKLTANISVKERNLFGTGQSGQVYVDVSQKRQIYNLSITNPRILDSRYSLSYSIFKSSYVNWNYTEYTAGLGLSVGKALTDTLRTSVSYNLSQTDVRDFASGTEGIYSFFFSKRGAWKSSISPSISFDNTDDYYFPKNGIIASAYAEYSGIGGDEKYMKLYGKAAFYYHLKSMLGLDLIARYKTQLGYVSQDGYAPITNLFYMGGINSVRGFQSGSISPDISTLYIGGNYMMTNSFELSYGLLESLQMRVSLFFDYGFIGNYNRRDILYLDKSVREQNLSRSSWGAAIEWVSPIGPIVLVFPKAINPQKNDKTSGFEFTMGTRF